MNFLLILFPFFIVFEWSCGIPEDDSVVPEEEPLFDSPSEAKGEPSPSAIDEFLKEHPDIKRMPTTGGKGRTKMKNVFNQFGEIVAVPDISAEEKSKVVAKPPQTEPIPSYPYPYPYPSPYGMNPYYQFGYGPPGVGPMAAPPPPIPPQSIPPKIEEKAKVVPQSRQKSEHKSEVKTKAVFSEKHSKYELKPPNEDKEQANSEIEMNQKMNELLDKRIASQMTVIPTNNRTDQTVSHTMPPPMMPYPPPYPQPYPYYPQNQFKIDNKNIQILPMGFPNGAAMDPNLLKQLESGRAKLDMANARVIPLDVIETTTTSTTTERTTPGTESESLEDRPELPEVVFPKPKPKPKRRRRLRSRKHKQQNRKTEEKLKRKPHFLMRARLNNLPKKNDTGTDKWWSNPVPELCKEEIYELKRCKPRKKEKRWSFNESDEKCYLYIDFCHSVKKNTFLTLKECMTTCWRPK